ncbi:putative oxidoreductase [Murinocardiopsis flavida]|uniref:Putative oxidoreductase n=1 Tax=Murinocardiopsis flavida TaxID=645275 RepID=A0A2P8DSR9_9ACTN|nr:DoxX family protein [Murinocardiopsis flavida]PSL00257.1 putative oxidoreductase [Murinocardiopsis flavida]
MVALTTSMHRAGDATALIARIAIGAVFVAHGWHKLSGLDGTAQSFAGLGLPMPRMAALLGVVIEVGGGTLLAIGLLLPLAAVGLAAMMAAAYGLVHAGDPLIAPGGGPSFELVLVLGAAALAVGFNGGRFALDRLLPWSRPRAAAPAARTAGAVADR